MTVNDNRIDQAEPARLRIERAEAMQGLRGGLRYGDGREALAAARRADKR